MKLLATQFVFLIAAAMDASSFEGWRVTGGDKARLRQFPFVVFLSIGREKCTGSILNSDTILTAAHCVANKTAEQIMVHAGFVQLEDHSRSSHKVRSIRVNPEYKSGVNGDDFAILKLDNSIVFDDYRKAIELGSDSDLPAFGDKALFAGYGVPQVGTLVWTHLTRFKCNCRDQCGSKIVCIAQSPSNADAGDSGGPLFVHRDSKFYQIAVHSGTIGASRARYLFKLMVRVDHAAHFIRKNM